MLTLMVFLLGSGITAGKYLGCSFWPMYACACLLVFLSILYDKSDKAAFFVYTAVFFLGALLFKYATTIFPCDIANFIGVRQGEYSVRGNIKSNPVIEGGRFSFLLEADEIAFSKTKFSCYGLLRVYLDTSVPIACGERVMLRGKIHSVISKDRFYNNRYYEYLRNQDIRGIMRVSSSQGAFILHVPARFNIQRLSFLIKDNIQDKLHRYNRGISSAILDAMVLGDKRNIPLAVTSIMVKSGTIHILAGQYSEIANLKS